MLELKNKDTEAIHSTLVNKNNMLQEKLKETERLLREQNAAATRLKIENTYLTDDVAEQAKVIAQIPNEILVHLDGTSRKRKPVEQLSNHQKRRRLAEVKKSLEWLGDLLTTSDQEILENLREKTPITENPDAPTVRQWLHYKDRTFMSDNQYFELTKLVPEAPKLYTLKKERKILNTNIIQQLGITQKEGSVIVDPEKVAELIALKHGEVESLKITMDHRKNEGRNELLLGLIPVCDGVLHSPTAVYPIALFHGKEEDVHGLFDDFAIINKFIDSHSERSFCVTMDLKSYWILSGKKYKRGTDEFCPYCKCCKSKMEQTIRKKFEPKSDITDLGALHIKPKDFCFCWLHMVLRITETLIRHQVRHYYDLSKTGTQQRLDTWTEILQQITGNSNVKVTPPKKADEFDPSFGKVLGLTGDLAYRVINNYEKFIHLCKPEERLKTKVANVWVTWCSIVHFVDSNTKPTQEFRKMLDRFGNSLLDTYEWKILTPYTHILVHHCADVMDRFGNIPKYSQEGLEAANKLHKKIATRNTNHTKSKSVIQQVLHVYRITND